MRSLVMPAILALGLATLACRGVEIGATPTASDVEVAGEARVESIEILMLESFPVQVNVVARGNLPDGCTRIDQISEERVGNEFRITITTVRPADAVCTEALVPFEEVISLDVYGLEAGVYAVDVNGVTGTFELAVDNVPVEEGARGAIGGRVWHDLCAVPYESVAEPPEGCVRDADGGLVANGLLEVGEPGLEGVQVTLGEGPCPATGLAVALTDADGWYRFSELEPGAYCVSVDALDSVNESILIPGGWTHPGGEGLASATVTLTEGIEELGVNFGWDYQFLP